MAIQTIGVRAVLLGLEAYQRGASSMTAATLQIGNAAKMAESPVVRFGTSLNNFGRSVSNVGSALTLGLTTPLIVAGGMAQKAAIEYEDAFFGIGKTVDGMLDVMEDGTVVMTEEGEKLSAAIREMALEVPIAAKELANIGMIAGQLGVEGTDNILEFTRIIGEMGVATNLSSEQAAFSLARFDAVMNEQENSARDYANVIVDLGNNFAVTEADIVAAGLRIAPIAQAMGIGGEEALALGAALRASGVEVQAGASAIQRTILEMNEAVNLGTGALGPFAETIGMSTEQFRSMWQEGLPADRIDLLFQFVDGLGDVEEKGGNVSATLDSLNLSQIRTIRTMFALEGATDVFGDALGRAREEIDGGNALAEEATKRFGSMKSQLGLVKNEITDLAITIGLQLAPMFLDFLQNTIVPLVKKFSEMSPELQANILKFAGLAAAAGPALIVLGAVLSALGTLITVAPVVAASIGAVAGALLSLPAAGALAAFGAVGLVVAANFETVRKVMTEVGGAVQTSAGQIAEGARETGKSLGESFSELTENILPTLQSTFGPIIEDIGDVLTTVFADVGPFVVEQMEKVSDWFQENLPLIQATVETVSAAIAAAWTVIGPILLAAVEFVWETIKTIIGSVLDTILGLITLVMQVITGDWEGAWETIKEIVTNIFEATIDIIENLLNTIAGFFDTDLQGIGETWSGVWENLKLIVSTFTGNILSDITEFIESIGEFFTGLWDDITGGVESGGQSIADGFTEFTDSVKEVVSNALASIGEFFTNFWNSIVEGFTEFGDSVKEAVSNALDGISEFFENMWVDIITFLTKGGGQVGDIFRGIGKIIFNVVSIIVTVVVAFFTILVLSVLLIIKKLAEGFSIIFWSIVNTVSSILEKIRMFFVNAFTAIATFITNSLLQIQTFFITTWQSIVNTVTPILLTLQQFFSYVFNAIATFIRLKLLQIKLFFTTTWQAIKETVTTFFEEVLLVISTKILEWIAAFLIFFTDIKTKVSEFVTTFVESIGELATKVIEKFTEIYESVKETIDEFVSTVIEKISTMVSNVIEKISSVVSEFKQAALDWMTAIVDGIESGTGKVLEAVRTLAKKMIDKLLGALSGSPVLFTYHIGEDMMRDLAAGVEAMAGPTINNIANTVSQGAGAGFGGLTSAPAPAAAGAQFVPVPIETTKFVVNANYTREQSPDTVGEQLANLVNLNG